MKLFEMEMQFIEAFNDAVKDIEIAEENERPLTLRQVIEIGFNNLTLSINGLSYTGYCDLDFTDEQLNLPVVFNGWDYDDDNYRIVHLTPAYE